jgi:ABC-type transporter Mla subunit MlaD
MTDEHDLTDELARSVEAHEREVKHAIESLGTVQAELDDVAGQVDDETVDRLTALGRSLERHERHLEAVVSTLDDHKSIVRSGDSVDGQALEEAMARARHRARQESSPLAPEPEAEEGPD